MFLIVEHCLCVASVQAAQKFLFLKRLIKRDSYAYSAGYRHVSEHPLIAVLTDDSNRLSSKPPLEQSCPELNHLLKHLLIRGVLVFRLRIPLRLRYECHFIFVFLG